MVFNLLFSRMHQPWIRAVLLLGWPQLGLSLVVLGEPALPDWLAAWALFSAGLYAFRALALKEVGLWISFLATSAWALLWLPLLDATSSQLVAYQALGFSVPLALLALLAAMLERHFGAAYCGLHGGLAQTVPRFSGVLVVVVLAVVATPVFPGFFSLVATMMGAMPSTALALATVWLLWSWAGARLLQGLVVGAAATEVMPDLSRSATWFYALVLGLLVLFALQLTGELL
jgi:NADH:ubiquinone oxidoreductase subunit 4 (subunit M)